MFFSTFVFLTLALKVYAESENSTRQVYFSLIVSGGENGYRSTGGIPSINLALDAVRKRQLLPGYNLTHGEIRNSKCTRTDSLDVFFKDVQLGAVPKIAVVGCGCSTATEPVAEISHYWNITQISFAAALSSLSDRSKFRYYFRTTPSFANYAPAILGVLNNFNWRQLAFITQNQNLFLKVFTDFEELLQNLRDGSSELCCFDNHDIDIDSEVFVDNGDPVAAAIKIFDQQKFHIFMLNCYSMYTRKIICEALKRNFVYPDYGWIMFGWYPERWWTEEVAGEQPIDGCTDQELELFLKKSRSLIVHLLPEPDDYNQTTNAGISANEFAKKYNNKMENSEYNISTVYVIAFDTIWTLALVLNATEDMRMNNVSKNDSETCSNLEGELVPLDEFNYSNAYMGCVMKENYHNVNFTGVSGPVKYDPNGTIIYTRIRLSQYRERNGMVVSKRFGYLDRESNFKLVFESGESDTTLYPDGVPPDGVPIVAIQSLHIVLIIVYYLLAVCGIIVSITSCTFNFLYRNYKVIRLTTPLLSYVIIGGAILMYLSVFVGLLPTTDRVVIRMQCIVHVWLYGVGYLLVYGTVLAKMWRVYQIFHNPNPNKAVLRTWHLVCVVCGVTGVGVLFILARSIAQGLTEPELVTNTENPEGKTASDIHVDYKVWQCYHSGSAPFYLDLLPFVYLGLLQLVGIILAFQTRKVKIQVLNDSKSVTALIYISSIVLVVIVLVTFVLGSYNNARIALFYGGIISLATVSLMLIFVPKVVHLHKDPKGKEIFSDLDPSRRSEKAEKRDSQVINLSDLSDSDKVAALNSRVARLKETLSISNKRIAELEAIVN